MAERRRRPSGPAAEPSAPGAPAAESPAPYSEPPLPASDALGAAFFIRSALEVARDLIGFTFLFDGCGGRIVEAEAYAPDDSASHSFRGRTARNDVMFGPPGRLYVYFIYGMYFCANISCDDDGVGAAVLLRALEPTYGRERMIERRGMTNPRLLCAGPGRLAQALALTRAENGLTLAAAARPGAAVVYPRAPGPPPPIVAAPRIGVDDDRRLWRFLMGDNRFVSKPAPRLPTNLG